MVLVYEALIAIYGSARQVDAELSHPTVWRLVRNVVAEVAGVELPDAPMRRHHYLYGRNRALDDPSFLDHVRELHRRRAAEQATEIGLLETTGPGSWTHPHPTRVVYGDGKVLTPLYRAKPGDERIDPKTGEIKALRAEPDADLHFEGTGEVAWGTKFVLMATRGPEPRARIILDFDFVADKGAESKVAMGCVERLAAHVPGAQALVYDTALRGVHHQRLLREFGLLPVNRVASAVAGAKGPRRSGGKRVEKTAFVEQKSVQRPDGAATRVELFSKGGAVGLVEVGSDGEPTFTRLTRIRTHRIKDKSGLFRWYNDYQLPDSLGRAVVTVRLHGDRSDNARRFNRAENVRPIAASDPDFPTLFRMRNDAESINRDLEDTMYLRRAHSVGHRRQLLNLLGYALAVNGLALHRHQRRRLAA